VKKPTNLDEKRSSASSTDLMLVARRAVETKSNLLETVPAPAFVSLRK
jgi:hypothetical protein